MDFLSTLVGAAHLIFPVGADLRVRPFWAAHLGALLHCDDFSYSYLLR